MKKLALIATVAAIAMPMSANAAKETMKEKQWFDGATKADVQVYSEEQIASSPFIPDEGQTLTVEMANTDNVLYLDGKAAFTIEPDGDKYYANNGFNQAENGLIYHIVDGEALYVTVPETTVYTFTADVQDEDHDGYADDVDFTMDSTTK